MIAQEFYEKYKGKYFMYGNEKVQVVGFERDSDFIIVYVFGHELQFIKDSSYFIAEEYASMSDSFSILSIYEEPFCKFVELYETPMQPCIEYAKGQISKQRFHAACCAMQGIVSGIMQSTEWNGWSDDYISKRAFEIADELLKQGGFTE